MTPGRAQIAQGRYGVGDAGVFLPKYLQFRERQLAGGAPDLLRVPLGYVKGLSRSFTSASGAIEIDLRSGRFQLDLGGLTPSATFSVSLVGQSTTGDGSGRALTLATFVAAETSHRVTGMLPMHLLRDATLDRIIVSGGISGDEPVASGSIGIFQKIWLRRLSLVDAGTGAVLFRETAAAPPLAALMPDVAGEASRSVPESTLALLAPPGASPAAPARAAALDTLISQGARLFFEETFRGNGRTCGTCHPASNNFTIDPAYIATLPPDDPLFVAEFNPALALLEVPLLMRRYGLVLENVDGLEDPASKYVMRGVSHTLGLAVSIQPDPGLANGPSHMMGWSGDGAPGSGSLREFAIGAVTQHLTRSLDRVAGRDFRLPSEHQLDAMEAFQLSLGRSADYDLGAITFVDAAIEAGKALFVDGTGDPSAGGRCSACHVNAGALNSSLANRNFNTNVEDAPHPARAVLPFPFDGGFGQTDNGDGTFGDRRFNTTSVVEAADTAPFFHNTDLSCVGGPVAGACAVDALLPSEVWVTDPADSRASASDGDARRRILTALAETSLVAIQRRLAGAMRKGAAQRYHEFSCLYPGLDSRIPQYHVAAYVGVSPEFLSALRKRLVRGRAAERPAGLARSGAC